MIELTQKDFAVIQLQEVLESIRAKKRINPASKADLAWNRALYKVIGIINTKIESFK